MLYFCKKPSSLQQEIIKSSSQIVARGGSLTRCITLMSNCYSTLILPQKALNSLEEHL